MNGDSKTSATTPPMLETVAFEVGSVPMLSFGYLYIEFAAAGPKLLTSIEEADLQCLHYKTMVVQKLLPFEHASLLVLAFLSLVKKSVSFYFGGGGSSLSPLLTFPVDAGKGS